MMDNSKQGFLTLSNLLTFLPLKFNINLTINQLNIFFDYLDKDKDGLITYDDFSNFFENQFSTKLFSNQKIELYELMNKIQDNFLIFLNSNEIDLTKIYQKYDNGKGFLILDEVLFLFREILNVKLNQEDGRLLIELIFNEKNIFEISYRKFLIILEVFGINIDLFTNVKKKFFFFSLIFKFKLYSYLV
jgi:hypothetical protein